MCAAAVNKGTSQGFRDIVKGILEKEGVLALWRGNSVAVIRVAPYMSIQFAAFETCKEKLRPRLGKGPLLSLTAGAIAGTAWHSAPAAESWWLVGVVAVSSTYPLDTVSRAAAGATASNSCHYRSERGWHCRQKDWPKLATVVW